VKPYDPRITSGVALTALTVWIGGLFTLGAVVAPTVFHAVPFDLAADTMAVVFERYDKLAMGAAAVVLGTEALRGWKDESRSRAAFARVAVTLALVAMAVVEGLWITPTIAELHAGGAVRGVGEAGELLATTHTLAEQLGKAQALIAVVLIGLHMATLDTRGPRKKKAKLAEGGRSAPDPS
jgi:hypothetical protein